MKPCRRILPVVLFVAAWMLTAASAQAQAKFEATLDRDTISLGESATLTLTAENGSLQSDVNPPPVQGLQYGSVSSQQQWFYNGSQMTARHIFSVEIHPAREGTFTIPAITATVDGRHLSSKPVTLKVVKGNPPAAPGQNEAAFVRLSAPTNTLYAGQVIPLDIQCYCQAAALGRVDQPQLSSDAFIIGVVPDVPKSAPQVNVNGTIYYLINFRVPVTPTRAGDLTLGPATWALTVVTRRDIFGNPFATAPVNPSSDTLQFHILPIPTNNVPPGFNGAVGQFSLAQFEAGPTSVAVGDPITLKIRITGKGAFDALTLPNDETAWRDFKTYPPSKKFDSTDPAQIEGSKYFEQVVTPQNAAIKEIPPFVFSYFDPEKCAFRTLTHAAIPLHVLPVAATPPPSVAIASAAAGSAQAPAQEIVNIKVRLGSVAMAGPPLWQRPGFLAWQALAPLAWICALLWRRQKDRLANNPRLRRRREVARLVQQGLGELSALAAANDAEAFYAAVFRLLQEQLGERLDLAASAITEAVLEQARDSGLSGPTEALLRELFHACNQFRYTPEHTAQELASLIPKVKTALHDLQRMTPPAAAPAVKNILQGAGLLVLLLAAAGARAADADASAQFDLANKLYEEGQYASSAAAYEKLAQTGPAAAALYFNLGNAWFKSGQLGRAICAWRRAQELAPRDPDVRANLQFARNQAGLGAPALAGVPWARWTGRLTVNEWTVLSSLAVAFLFILLTVRQVRPALKKSSNGLAWTLAAASVCGLTCLGLALDARYGTQSSVVIVPESVLRLGPDDKAASVFTVHDGAELLVTDRSQGWLEVSDAAKHKGWLPQTEVVFAP
jgi:tetratricopeptide (TPR) repeat protein